jgi:hypothetical protein
MFGQLSVFKRHDCCLSLFAQVIGEHFVIFYIGHYQVNMEQLKMLIAGITQLRTCHYTTVNISYGKSDRRIAHRHKLALILLPLKSGISLLVHDPLS